VFLLRNVSRLRFLVSRLAGLFEQPACSASPGPKVCFMKTHRKIRDATSALRLTSAIMGSGVFGMCERWIWDRKFRHDIRSVSSSAP
jgi:hypothetical protein